MPSHRTETLERHVLIVDDEVNIRKTLAEILRDEGFQVTTAATGTEAVRLCGERHFDAVLMDVRMPGMNGTRALRQIRQHQEGVRVILMSAFSIDGLKEAALDDGATAFLSKPLDLDQVVSLVGETNDTAILVAEDEQDIAEMLHERLGREGYRVTVVKSAEEALELAGQIRFDLMFLDANLPSMNGLDLYEAIKRIAPSTVVIMIAEREQAIERLAREAIRQNAYTIVRKPLDVEHIVQMLGRLTSKQLSGGNRKPPLSEP